MKVKVLFFSYGPDTFITTAGQYLQNEDKVYVVLEMPDGKRHTVNLYKYTDLPKETLNNLVRRLTNLFKDKVFKIPETHQPTDDQIVGHYVQGVPGNRKTVVRKNYRKLNNFIRKQITGNSKIIPL